jgi:hypothetical protein
LAGPGLSTSIVAATAGHPTWANTVGTMLNRFDNSNGSDGQFLRRAGGLWLPTTFTVDMLPAGIGLVVFTAAFGSRPTSDAARPIISIGAQPSWALPSDLNFPA